MPTGSGHSPRHAALVAELAAEIASKRYPVGARFPVEQELQERFGVGRHTVREALKVLTEQGLLGRRRKTGTVVLAHQQVEHYVHSLRDLHGLFDFAQNTSLEIQHEGYALAKPSIVGSDELASKRWFRLAGVRSTKADGRPLCWSEILIPEQFVPDREAMRSGTEAAYALVMRQFKLKLAYVEQQISASRLPSGLSRLLDADPDTAALLVRRRYVAHTGLTFEISHNTYPADRYSVSSVIRQRE